jgi:hypothetical protein
MTSDFLLRVGAVVAAVAVVACPWLVGQLRKRWPKSSPSVAQPDDAFAVIEIARRLQASGNSRGVELCQQLLDVILIPERKK